MKQIILLLTVVFTVSLLFISLNAQSNSSLGANRFIISPTPTPTPGPITLSPKFAVSAADVRKTFDAAELRGEHQQNISIGEEHSLNVIGQTALNQAVTLKLSVKFLSPLDQARQFGYEFGLVAKHRTPADRKDYEDRMVSGIVQNSNLAAFIVKLLPLPDPDLNLPTVSFSLIDRNGNDISATTEPHGYAASLTNLFEAVALQEEGQELIFLLVDASGPRITNQMDRMTLVVRVDEQAQNIQYSLKP
jgi:hypothetical protein